MVLQNSGRFVSNKKDENPGRSGVSAPERYIPYFYIKLKSNLYFFREETSEYRLRLSLENEAIDVKYGFERLSDCQEHTGFLLNMHSVMRII